MTSPPPDALVARTIRALTRVMVAGGAAAVALGLAAVAVLVLTGPDGGRAGPVLTLLALGQLAAIGTAGVGAVGTWRVLRRPGDASAGTGASAADAVAAVRVRSTTARRLAVLARATGVACVVAVAAWALAEPAAAFGALLGGLVAAQVAVLDVALARGLAGPAGAT